MRGGKVTDPENRLFAAGVAVVKKVVVKNLLEPFFQFLLSLLALGPHSIFS